VETRRRVTDPNPSADAADELIARLASYLVDTRNADDIRRAIATWQDDAVNAGLEVEQLLVQFKKVLLGMLPSQQSKNDVERLRDRRELILMCIEEFYRDRRNK
jgi:hypothetical protein